MQYICHIHSQTNHITLSTIIRTCPRSVKVSVLSNPACSIFWLVVLISDYLVINLNLNHSSKKGGIYSELQHMTQSVLVVRTFVYGIIFVEKRENSKNPKTNTNVHTSKILKFNTPTLPHFLCEYFIVCFLNCTNVENKILIMCHVFNALCHVSVLITKHLTKNTFVS